MDFEPILSINRVKIDESSTITKCYCCLAENRSVVNLQTCKHAEFLQDLHKMGLSKLTVCRLCHSMLRKIQLFQNQVRESCMVLKKQIPHTTTSKLNNLQQSNITTYTLSEESEPEIKHELERANEIESTPFKFITDVKIEHESSSSDFENSLPLSEVKKTEKSKPKFKRKNINLWQRKIFPIDDKYKDKIIVYNLNREELEEERERESKKESYLKLPFKCESCVKGFDHENTLKNHNDKQHSQKKSGVECDICKTILGPTSYKEHSRRHFRRFQCVVCGKRSQDIYSISQHFNQQHEAGAISQEFQCDQCEFTTDSNRVYRYHRDKHKQKQQCTVCGNTYVSVTSLRVHMLHVHKQSARVYTCSLCDKSYSSKSGLHSHNASTHENTGAYCTACRAHFRTKTGLTHHLRTHSAHLTPHNKRFSCNKCDSAFLTRTALQEHIDWDHLKTVKHACPKCSKAFKSAVTMRNHVNFVHEKRRPPRDKICDYCGSGFTTIAILRCHIRTHTGERPLHCSHCGATFAHSAALYTHNKLLHKSL